MDSSGLNYYINTSREKVETMRIKEAERLLEDFTREITQWKTEPNTIMKRSDPEECIKFANYLNDKYVCNNLDIISSNKGVRRIRKGVIQMIEKIADKQCLPDVISNSNSNSNINLVIDEDLENGNDDDDIIPVDNINLCFVGGVSTGKSTVLNGIFCEELTQCKIKRTTMVPTVYVENENNIDLEPQEIFRRIMEKNKEIIELTESGQKLDKKNYSELVFNVGKLDINILEGSYVNVYDIPGLNDARTKDIYYDYLETNFHKFNLVVFMVDIHSGLNTSDEMDMLKFITNNTWEQFDRNKRQIYTLVVVNKADDMRLDEDTGFLEITGELKEMYEQVENTITKEFASKNIIDSLIGIIPLCAIDAYLYRMVNKHGCSFKLTPEQILKIGVNENGKKFSTLKPDTQKTRVYDILKDQSFIETMIKLSGFSHLESILHKFLQENDKGSKLRIDNLLYELKKLPKLSDVVVDNGWFDLKQMTTLVQQYCNIYDNIKKIDSNEYNAIVSSFVAELTTILRQKVIAWPSYNSNAITNLINLYNRFIELIINPYLRDYYNVSEYPKFLTEHVISMIHNEIKQAITIYNIIQYLHVLIKINMFTKYNIEELFDRIVMNILEENTITFYKNTDEIDRLIQLLEQCSKTGTNLSKILRFVIINQLNLDKDGELYKKGLLYEKYRELPIRSYISQLSKIFKVRPHIQEVIVGLEPSDFETYKLDLYYLKYEREYNPINFVNM
jgi:GTP-binding protein EngB required for normal cell division